MKKGPESIQTLQLLNALRKAGKKHAAWKRVAELLSKPARQKVEVSLHKLSRLTTSGQTIIIPGKLLATGNLAHPLTLACFKASRNALSKAKAGGARVMTIRKLMQDSPTGSKTRIIT